MFSSSVNLYEEKLKITLSVLWLSLKILFGEIFRRFYNFHLCIFSWCKMDLSWTTRNKEQIKEKSNTENVLCNSSLTLCVSFSKVLILFRFDLISSSSNLSWHFLYTWELLRCLFANLKRRNFGITPFFFILIMQISLGSTCHLNIPT